MQNQQTRIYLTSLGFKHRKSIKETEKDFDFYDLEGIGSFKIANSHVITKFEDLMKKIVLDSFEQGREFGRRDAISQIVDKLTSFAEPEQAE